MFSKKSIKATQIFFYVATLFFGSSVLSASADEAGKNAYTAKGCPACHGAQGVSAIPTYPNLAGQNEAYLIRNPCCPHDVTSRAHYMVTYMLAALHDTTQTLCA